MAEARPRNRSIFGFHWPRMPKIQPFCFGPGLCARRYPLPSPWFCLRGDRRTGCDLVAGEPRPDDFFFCKLPKGFPLATQIPYELVPNARRHCGN